MSPLWIIVIVIVVCAFVAAGIADFRRRRVRDLDKQTGTHGYATGQRRDAQYRADKWSGGDH